MSRPVRVEFPGATYHAMLHDVDGSPPKCVPRLILKKISFSQPREIRRFVRGHSIDEEPCTRGRLTLIGLKWPAW